MERAGIQSMAVSNTILPMHCLPPHTVAFVCGYSHTVCINCSASNPSSILSPFLDISTLKNLYILQATGLMKLVSVQIDMDLIG